MPTTEVIYRCPECGQEWHAEVDTNDYCQFLQGAEPGEVFHYLSVDELTQLLSGVCDNCIKNYNQNGTDTSSIRDKQMSS